MALRAGGIGGGGDGTSGAPRRLDASASDTGASDAGLPASDAPGPGSPEPTIQWDATRSTGRTWYRRRRTAIGAATATVLLVTLGSLSALSADRSHDNSPKPTGRSRTTETGTSHHPRPLRPAPPQPCAGLAVRRNTGYGKSRGKGRTLGGHEERRPRADRCALAWTVDSQIWDGGCGYDYVIDKEPTQVPRRRWSRTPECGRRRRGGAGAADDGADLGAGEVVHGRGPGGPPGPYRQPRRPGHRQRVRHGPGMRRRTGAP